MKRYFNMGKPDPSKTIVLAGSGRSGTTWLSNIIAAGPARRVIFEPFASSYVPETPHFAFFYARPNAQYEELSSFVEKALTGRVENKWTNQTQHWSDHWAWKYLVKEIRIPFMLAWLDQTFHPRIVFTIRHPCAVVLSRMRTKWQAHLDSFLMQERLVSDWLAPYLEIIHRAETNVEKHAALWAVENMVPLSQLPNYHWVFTTYEQFYMSPQTESVRIMSELGIRPNWFVNREIKKVASVTRPDSPLRQGGDALKAWQKDLSKHEIKVILDIVQAFGIDLYTSNILPNTTTSTISQVD